MFFMNNYLKDPSCSRGLEYYMCEASMMNVSVVKMLEDLGVEKRKTFYG